MTARDATLTELEIALAHQERVSEDLSEIVRAQDDRLDRLERHVSALLDRISALEAGGPALPPADSRPPHW